MRRPKTACEMRHSVITDIEFKVRARRRGRNLPNSYDDKPRGDHFHRSWKRHRSHQWKAA